MNKDMDMEEHVENIYNILDERGKALQRQGKVLESNQQNIELLIMTLKGNAEFGTEGYNDRISRNEKNIDKVDSKVAKQEKRFNNIYNKIIGICVGVSIAASTLGYLITNKVVDSKPKAQIERKKAPTAPSVYEAIKPKDITQNIARNYEQD